MRSLSGQTRYNFMLICLHSDLKRRMALVVANGRIGAMLDQRLHEVSKTEARDIM